MVYPLIKERPYYGDRLTPVPLELEPASADWRKVSMDFQKMLQTPTVTLYAERIQRDPDKGMVACCASGGTGTAYQPEGDDYSTLHHWVLGGSC